MKCPECERAGAFFDGELAGSERTAYEAHLASCHDCAMELEHRKHVSRLLSIAIETERRAARTVVTFSHLKQRKLLRWSKGLALAASFLFAVSGFLLLNADGRARHASDAGWERTAVMPHLAAVRVDSVDPVAQKLLGMMP
jgi:anti-sigma factor RsiW